MYDQDTVVRDAGDDIVTPLSQAKLMMLLPLVQMRKWVKIISQAI